MNKPTSPSPLSQRQRCSCSRQQMSFSLLKCYDQVIERLYSSVTLQSWLLKEKWLQRERERILPLSYRERFARRLEQIFRWWRSKC